jgi:SPP1 gp7 family putative phage head morphogenesis protein
VKVSLADLRALAAASDAIERLKVEAQAIADDAQARTGVIDFFEVPAGGLFDVRPERALAYFQAKGLRPTFSYADMLGAAHDQAFTVAKLMDVDLLAQVRDSLTSALAAGTPLKEWSKQLRPQLEAAGWWGRQTVIDPVTNKPVKSQLGSPWRLDTIFSTNMQTAYAAQAWQEIEEQADLAPYLIYDAVDDLRTREAHRQWDRRTLPVTDPWWRTHYPPNGFSCRCGVIQVSREELDAMGIRPGPAPAEGTYLWKNPRTGVSERVPVGIDPGFDRNVGQGGTAPPLRQVIKEKTKRAPRKPKATAEAVQAVQAALARPFDTKTRAGTWHAASFEKAPDWLLDKVLAEQDVKVQKRSKKNAWARNGELIEMNGKKETTAMGRAVWRHEFGHILDYRLGSKPSQFGAKRGYVSSTARFVGPVQADAQKFVVAAGRGLDFDDSQAHAAIVKTYADADAEMIAAEAGEREGLLRAAATRAGLDYDAFRGLLRESTFIEETFGALGIASVGNAIRMRRMIEAIRLQDPEMFLRKVSFYDESRDPSGSDVYAMRKLNQQTMAKDGSLAMLSDLAGAATKNRVVGHADGWWGHSTSYYNQAGYKQYTEVFANLTALAGHPNAYWWEVVRLLMPRTAGMYRQIIEDKP